MKRDQNYTAICAGLPDEQLYGLYRPEPWRTLPAEGRKALLQETVRRENVRSGYDCRADVALEPLPPNEAGHESGGRIVLNEDMALQDRMSVQCGNRTITYRPPDMGYRMLETVLHENRHVVQEAVIRGEIPAEQSDRLLLMANNPTVSVVDGRIATQYLEGRTDYELYCLQPCELDAFRTAQDRTAEILTALQARYGADPAMEAYRQRMSEEGWQAHTAAASEAYQCADVPAAIAITLRNAYTGESNPVDPAVEQAVKAEMFASTEQEYGNAAMRTPAQEQESNLWMSM